MFTGIVQGQAEITRIEKHSGLHRFEVRFPPGSLEGITIGASVALNGACLTVVSHQGDQLVFDIMMETLRCTTLADRQAGDRVNFERAARIGDEIGGHLLSGHVHTVARVATVETPENNRRITFEVPEQWMPYVIPKGYIAIDGASLTIGEVESNRFSVYLIPETLRVTHFGQLEPGDSVNIEIDSQTQTIVDTLARLGYTPQK
ncbi:riboflavin synthase subunit alpha [Marinobacteraceae bacterium S3BR75-40.1]